MNGIHAGAHTTNDGPAENHKATHWDFVEFRILKPLDNRQIFLNLFRKTVACTK